jgi:hypothetical protein
MAGPQKDRAGSRRAGNNKTCMEVFTAIVSYSGYGIAKGPQFDTKSGVLII